MEYFRKYGVPPFRLAVIHGGPGAPGDMAPMAKELSSEWGVLEPLQSAMSVASQIEELKSTLVAEAVLPLTLIGFSWGAWLSALLSAQYPELIKRLILIGSGPFEQQYVPQIQERRFERLSQAEQTELSRLNEDLQNPTMKDKAALFSRFGAIFSKVDSYDPLEHESDVFEYQIEVFQKVWSEAAELRRSGELLERIKQISCPVLAIHGEDDPHPIEGVEVPLSRVLQDFRYARLRHCGHKPWIERQAKDDFYALLKNALRWE